MESFKRKSLSTYGHTFVIEAVLFVVVAGN